MATSNVRLRRGSRLSPFQVGVEELWLCDTHLLCIRNIVGVEQYQRFYYRDIERISLVTTRTGAWVAGVCAAVLALCVWLLVEAGATWVVLIPFGIILLPVIFHALTDDTCRVVLATRVNTRTLWSLTRVRVARRALTPLCERVCAAQAEERGKSVEGGEWSSELEKGSAELGVGSAELPPPLPRGAAPNWRWHWVTCAMLFLQAVAGLAMAYQPSVQGGFAMIGLVLLSALFCVMAQVAQGRQSPAPALRKACWWVLGYNLCLGFAAMMILGTIVAQRSDMLALLESMFSFVLDATGVLVPVLCLCHAAAVLLLAVWVGVASKRELP